VGLIFAHFGLHYADCIAALFVALIVIYVSIKLGKRAIDVLLDRAPEGIKSTIRKVAKEVPQITSVHDIRVRNAGADIFVDLCIHVDPKLSIEKAHNIAHQFEDLIHKRIERCTVHLHQEPEEKHPEDEINKKN
jgi:cation diffusion facilitator family transporter